jgi:hypothetical protein
MSYRVNPFKNVKFTDLGVREVGDAGRTYQVTYHGREDGFADFLGFIGKLSDEDMMAGNPRFYATPSQRNPFVTTNGVRQFHNRREAIAWLMGIHDARSAWLNEALVG